MSQGQRTHVSLLHSVRLEDVGSFANLLEKLLVGQLDVLSRLVSLPDDGSLEKCPEEALVTLCKWGFKSGKGRELTLFGCL